MNYRGRGRSPGPYSSIRSVVSTKSTNGGSKSSRPPTSPTKSSSSSTQSTSSSGSGHLTNSSLKPKKAIRRGTLGAATANATAIVASSRRSTFAEADDDVSVRSGRTTRSLSSFGSRRMMRLPLFGAKKDTAYPESPGPKEKSSKGRLEDKLDARAVARRQRSKTPTQRGRSMTPMSIVSPIKSPLATPTRKKVLSKAPQNQQKQLKTDGSSLEPAGQLQRSEEPAGQLQRSDSGCFHAPYSSSEDEYDDNASNRNEMSPITPRSGSPRSGGASPRGRRPMKLEKTWSCSAMSTHSAGENSAQTNLYFDEDDSTDFDTDDEADRNMNRNADGKKKKGRRGGRAPRRMTKIQRKKEKEAEERATVDSGIIPEGIREVEEENEDDSEDEYEDLNLSPTPKLFQPTNGRDLNRSATSDSLNNIICSNDDLDDIVSSCSYKMPAFGTMLGLEPVRRVGLSSTVGTGYSSDTSVRRKRIELQQQQQKEDRKLEKKSKEKNKRKSKSSKRDKTGKEASLNKAYLKVQAFHESFANYDFDEPDEVSVRSSRSEFVRKYTTGVYPKIGLEKEKTRDRSSSQRRSKKDKKKKKRKSKKSASTAGSTSDDDIYGDDLQNSFENHDSFSTATTEKQEVTKRMQELDDCFKHVDQKAKAGLVLPKTYDKRFEEIERFEAFLFEERNKLQKERATIAFERESLELQLNEETNKSESLSLQVRELEQQLQSLRLSHAGNNAELTTELEGLKTKFQRQIEDLRRQLMEKNNEIQGLKAREVSSRSNHSDASSDGSTICGKSRDRLQGELLQTTSKLMEKQQLLEQQSTELELLREELSGLRDGSGVSQFKDEISDLNAQKLQLEKELTQERKDNAAKLKDKDETISYLMGELARLKQEQSRDLNSSNHSRNSLSSLTSLRRGSSVNNGASFLPPSLSIQCQNNAQNEVSDEQDSSVHRRGSITSILGF